MYLLWDLEILREIIGTIKLHKFNDNVDDMLTAIEETCNKILAGDSTYESILCNTLKALLSGSDNNFNMFVKIFK